eukprot:s2413_g17.t1
MFTPPISWGDFEGMASGFGFQHHLLAAAFLSLNRGCCGCATHKLYPFEAASTEAQTGFSSDFFAHPPASRHHGPPRCFAALTLAYDEDRAAGVLKEPLRTQSQHDGRGPREVVQLEPGLHRTDRGAIDMDVDCELPHLRGGGDDLSHHGSYGNPQVQVRLETLWIIGEK